MQTHIITSDADLAPFANLFQPRAKVYKTISGAKRALAAHIACGGLDGLVALIVDFSIGGWRGKSGFGLFFATCPAS